MSYRPFQNGAVQGGRITGVGTGSTSTVVSSTAYGNDTLSRVQHNITFGAPFTNPPIVLPTTEGNTGGHGSILNLWVEDGSVTTTGCTLVSQDIAWSQNVILNWLAIDGNVPGYVEAGQVTGIGTTNTAGVRIYNTVTHSIHREAVSFGQTFNEPPIVIVAMQGNNSGHGGVINCWVERDSVTTTGFSALFTDFTTSNDITLNWLAMLQ